MIKKTFVLATVCAFLSGFAMAGVAFAADKGPEEITMESERGIKPAEFPHAQHQEEFDCGDCHHSKDEEGNQVAYEEGQDIQTCDTCHNKDSDMDEALNSLMKAGHKNCKGCHAEKAPEKQGCPTCHK
ncbi:MAG: cytochrome c3 family protein [Desulfurivibrionaceae bacterium]